MLVEQMHAFIFIALQGFLWDKALCWQISRCCHVTWCCIPTWHGSSGALHASTYFWLPLACIELLIQKGGQLAWLFMACVLWDCSCRIAQKHPAVAVKFISRPFLPLLGHIWSVQALCCFFYLKSPHRGPDHACSEFYFELVFLYFEWRT